MEGPSMKNIARDGNCSFRSLRLIVAFEAIQNNGRLDINIYEFDHQAAMNFRTNFYF
jgi:hypothetical protein